MNVYVVIPHWNGPDKLLGCLKALKQQTQAHTVIVVDNGSTDDSVFKVKKYFPHVKIIGLEENTGFTGGVNIGIKHAMGEKADHVALLNNDALPEPEWLYELVQIMDDETVGITTGLFLDGSGDNIDSTGDLYTCWGLPYPRQRGEHASQAPKEPELVFGASGGASLYRVKMFEEIGLFDQHYFAYLEDVDISWRAQLTGWKVKYTPRAVALHQIGGTSKSIKGFGTYHYMKNVPMLLWINVPMRFIPHIFPRLFFAYWTIMIKSWLTGKGWAATKGHFVFLKNNPYILFQRLKVQRTKTVSNDYIKSMIHWDLPPSASNLRRLRSFFTGK